MKKGQCQIFNICITRFPISMKSYIDWTERLYSSEIKLYMRITIFTEIWQNIFETEKYWNKKK